MAESGGAEAIWEQPLPWLGETESDGTAAPEGVSSPRPDRASESEAVAQASAPSSADDGSAAAIPAEPTGSLTEEASAGAEGQVTSEAESETVPDPEPASEPGSEPDRRAGAGSDPDEESHSPETSGASDITEPSPTVLPDQAGDAHSSDGGRGRYLRLLVARAGTMVAARGGADAESPDGQRERNVRLVGVMTAVAVLAALGLGTFAFMAVPSDEAPQTRAARVEDGVVPTPGLQDSVLSPRPSSSASVTAGSKDGSKQAKALVAKGGGVSADGAPTAAGARSQSSRAASAGDKSTDAGDPPKTDSKGSSTSKPRSTPASGNNTAVAGRMIVGYGSSRCVGVSARKGTDGSPLTLQGCAGEAWQKWVFASDGSVRSMGLCLDIANASSADGATIQVARCNGGWAQKFNLNSSHDLVNTRIGKCVDAKDMGTAAGTRLQLWECEGTSNQKWHLG
ncbi:ricin-type beta-trefoil lectin domain protein [Streptomyces fructofermentans]|uniref:ricin-type beta-trefoil lectin domain protein n=1 Tax=Streptomyces fructofermentans TaxID=152141 RepID=UPI0033CD3F10